MTNRKPMSDQRIKAIARAAGATVTVGFFPFGSEHFFANCAETEVDAASVDGALTALSEILVKKASEGRRNASSDMAEHERTLRALAAEETR